MLNLIHTRAAKMAEVSADISGDDIALLELSAIALLNTKKKNKERNESKKKEKK